jgi:hypothetical protein
MTTNQPIELGKVSEETKQPGPAATDNHIDPFGEPLG